MIMRPSMCVTRGLLHLAWRPPGASRRVPHLGVHKSQKARRKNEFTAPEQGNNGIAGSADLAPTSPQNHTLPKGDDYRWKESDGEQICIPGGWWPRQEHM
jgi:hypothetical protein